MEFDKEPNRFHWAQSSFISVGCILCRSLDKYTCKLQTVEYCVGIFGLMYFKSNKLKSCILESNCLITNGFRGQGPLDGARLSD